VPVSLDPAERDRPLRVISRQFSLISTNGSFRAVSGHSEPGFRAVDFVVQGNSCKCPLSPIADVQVTRNPLNQRAANGQEPTFARLAKKGFFRAMIRKKEDAYDLY